MEYVNWTNALLGLAGLGVVAAGVWYYKARI
jgi:hypothetical protein